MYSAHDRHSCFLKTLLVVIGLVGLVVLGSQIAMWAGLTDTMHLTQSALPLVLLIFVLAAAVPFVPGAEIGLALLLLFGADVALEVYLSMVAALSLAYFTGRFFPANLLRLHRLSLLARWYFGRTNGQHAAPGTFGTLAIGSMRVVARHRLAALAIALNMPGNSLIGGGGGLAMIAGASRQYSPSEFLLTTAIAVAPVPLCFAAMGWFGLTLPAF